MRSCWLAVVGVLTIATFVAGCASPPPNLFDRPTLAPDTAVRFRVPIGGCASPIVVINGRRWEPDTPWPYAPFPKNWHVTTEGPRSHTEEYLDGTVRVAHDRLVVSLPDGTVVKQYHPTTHPQALCA